MNGAADSAGHVMRTYDPEAMAIWPVDAAVGNVDTGGLECVAPLAA